MKSLNEIRDEQYDLASLAISEITENCWSVDYDTFCLGFNAGAKAERERSQILVEAIEEHPECAYKYRLEESLDQYNKGEMK